ncbi:MAG: sugar ABC transporter permease [bacterium]|nr:sugar ABC transporter permease [bacterium]MCM1374822.1 sugar ABC transporter permease [Muribaculum sp.]
MGGLKKNKVQTTSGRPSDASVGEAIAKGNAVTRSSLLVFGLGNILNKQIIRGLIFLAIEIAYIVYMISFGISAIGNFITLGTREQGQTYNEALGIYEYTAGDNSMLFLLYGVITIVLTLAIVFVACMSAKSAYCTQVRREKGMHVPTFKDDLLSLREENIHTGLMALPVIGIIIFTIVPLVFMILIAFTSYDHEHQPPGNLFTWVGLDNFKTMLGNGSKLAATFWPVLSWTLIWAVFATFSCFILGIILALLINRKGTRIKGFWRFMFVLSIAVPQFVSLLSMRTIFNANGPVNVLLREIGLIGTTESIPFFTDPTLAKITIICINLWIGIPFTMLSTTGILQNIPAELYEAAKIDGAGAFVIFRKITIPYIVFIMTPNLITSFTGNINNFNVIFLLSGGGPDTLDYYYAGKTDLLVTWLYRLTITQKDYNLGAVIGILVFIILATLSLLTYRHTGSYKDEGAFQ